ncbi:MGMT family protein [Sediminivirga luteola]|uniref:Methylated-DNA-[protein]-cysteine S-methyltransferase DNA binding domain-containing protein n=1 Tax=Sediminivirga luteola TaxID=1774748 RepID=A0A8J2TWB3_9MICO|nr:MGMT family protein [Sediminivirga luteola]MCI2265684.1 MGMT family protein [Sediminivirga luteola]GGA07434.1 hypothetical protein GCM10011333_07660 [Sediminivirga luteola]
MTSLEQPPDSAPGRDPAGFGGLVAAVVRAIPAGRVLSYGDIAELLERGGPRQVAAVMAAGAPGTAGWPWWRVVRADGSLPERLRPAALAEYRAEGTPLRAAADRPDMRRARWTPDAGELGELDRLHAALSVRRDPMDA